MNRKITLYFAFTIGFMIVIAVFVTATSYIHLAIASLLYTPLIYFAYRLLPLNVATASYTGQGSIRENIKPQKKAVESEKEFVVSDIDKRAFLKFMGATGVSFLLISIFGRRIESLIFNRGTQTSPAVTYSPKEITSGGPSVSPTAGYTIAEIEEGQIGYYGFINKDGAWFIMKEDLEAGSFRYAKGDSDFPSNWAKRGKLRYAYFHEVFF